jgi:hypothetical protein
VACSPLGAISSQVLLDLSPPIYLCKLPVAQPVRSVMHGWQVGTHRLVVQADRHQRLGATSREL